MSDLTPLLASRLPGPIASGLVDEFVQMRQDAMIGELGRSSPGKFVECFVQALEYLETGSYSEQPSVDAYLRGLESRSTSLEDGLRICGSRIARSMYSLRSKRGIAHKAALDPSLFDLTYCVAAAEWILSELIRVVSALTPDAASAAVRAIHAPLGAMIEDIAGKSVVLASVSVSDEILLILRANKEQGLSASELFDLMPRRDRKVASNALRKLWKDRCVEQLTTGVYTTTVLGLERVAALVKRSTN